MKIRTGNHHLPVETGVWHGIDIQERKCTLCSTNDIEDDFHYALKCPFYSEQRKKFVKMYYFTHPNVLKVQYHQNHHFELSSSFDRVSNYEQNDILHLKIGQVVTELSRILFLKWAESIVHV